ncbi:MAG TPA: GNAT family N-acetyltransferase [Candidatus Tumulicola sp.]
MTPAFVVRRFESPDAASVCEIFFRSVREVGPAKYEPAQLEAWAPRLPDPETWRRRCLELVTFVADDDAGETVGWIAMTREGCVDMLYCLHEATRRGIASELYVAVERSALDLGLPRLTARASAFAESFFKKRGWTVDERETVDCNGTPIERAVMSKILPRR